MKTNLKKIPADPVFNHHGVKAHKSTPLQELKRAVLACMLWEDSFYENGEAIGARIASLVKQVPAGKVAEIAVQAREKFHLRHAPLLVVREMIRLKMGNIAGRALSDVIQRPDEISEFLSLYWKDGKIPLAKQAKLGLAHAFQKFSEFQLARYRGEKNQISLRDVMFLVHPKPKTKAQERLWKKLADNKLEAPDTWETALAKGQDKKDSFERLLREGKLGYFALIRNLRNMVKANVNETLIRAALSAGANDSKILPYRFIAAARAAPQFENQLDAAMQLATADMRKLPGKTIVLIDTSPSMAHALSEKSDLTRKDAACGLAILCRELCEDVRIFAFSNTLAEVPARRGMALSDAILHAVPSNGTRLGAAVTEINALPHDRLIIVTDEESQDAVPASVAEHPYMINVSTSAHGVGYGAWTRLTGFSEAILSYIQESEDIDVEG